MYNEVFGKIPILGMIHLAGDNPVKRALEELTLFEEEGVDGAIIENYHGSTQNVLETLKAASVLDTNVVIGVNILPNEFLKAFPLALEYGAKFIQLDHVAGTYDSKPHGPETLNELLYSTFKNNYPEIMVVGGVWPKYYTPVEGSDLETDLRTGMERAEAIVVTGSGTGKETPFDKIRRFREIMGNHPLVIGAGLTPDNAYNQLSLADGAIVGSCLKPGNQTYNFVDRSRVRDLMDVVKDVRIFRD